MGTVSARLMFVVLVAGLAACDGSSTARSPLGPSGPVVSTPPAPSGFQLRGWVRDTAFRRLASATVEILDGPQAGLSATADADGNFVLPVTLSTATTLRASSENHIPLTQTWTPAVRPGGNYLSFYLSPVAPPVAVAGDYTLTLTADVACGLPDILRTRTYELRMTPSPPSTDRPDGTLFTGVLSGATFVDVPANFVSIAVAGNFLSVALFGSEGEQAVERVAPDTYFAFNSGASGLPGASGAAFLSAPARGTFDVCVQSTPLGKPYSRCDGEGSRCFSENHRLMLAER